MITSWQSDEQEALSVVVTVHRGVQVIGLGLYILKPMRRQQQVILITCLARISYGNSVRPSVRHDPVQIQAQVR